MKDLEKVRNKVLNIENMTAETFDHVKKEVANKFQEMDDDDSGHMDFGEMENLWWT